MNTRRNHPASPNRKSERDMMKENQNKNLEKAKELANGKKFVGSTKLLTKIEMGDNQIKEKKIK